MRPSLLLVFFFSLLQLRASWLSSLYTLSKVDSKSVSSEERVEEKTSESQAELPPHASDPWTLGLPFQVPVQSSLHSILVMVLSKLLSIAVGKEDPSKLYNIFMNTMAVFLASWLSPLINLLSESLGMKIPYINCLKQLSCYGKSIG